MIEDNSPLVSVLMTVYNREAYLAEAIESVLASTYKNLELIIVDDCSADNSNEIASRYVLADSRVHLYRHGENVGDYPNRNRAASYAKGKYIKFLDSDDAIFAWGLAYCVEQMERFPEAALGTLWFEESSTEKMVSSSEVIEEHFFKNELLNIGPSGTIFRRDHFEKIGFFNTDFGIASDVYVNIKLAAQHPVVLLPRIFFFYRKHEGQQQHNSRYAYMLNNYLYRQAVLKENILPLPGEKIMVLKKRMENNFAKDIIKTALVRQHWKRAVQLAGKANFNLKDLLTSIF